MRHQHISFLKSAIRLGGYYGLLFVVFWPAVVLIISEVIGILEEIGHE